MPYVLLYLLIINAAGWLIMRIDKARAQSGKLRISEASLFTVALIGGSIGTIAAMYQYRHKTRKLRFTLGLPLILVLQIGIGVIYYLVLK